jgi:carbon monoxide dehydrogenase subunit G
MSVLHFELNKDLNKVKSCLTDTEQFVRMHPLIYRMKPLGNDRYKVYERVKLGFLPYSFTYLASVHHADNSVFFHVKVMKITSISMTFTLQQEGEKCKVEEKIEIQTLLPIKAFMLKLFRTQHAVLFANIEKWA